MRTLGRGAFLSTPEFKPVAPRWQAHSLPLSSGCCYCHSGGSRGKVQGINAKVWVQWGMGATLSSGARSFRESLPTKSLSLLGEKDTVICELFTLWRSYPREEKRDFGVHLKHLKHVR